MQFEDSVKKHGIMGVFVTATNADENLDSLLEVTATGDQMKRTVLWFRHCWKCLGLSECTTKYRTKVNLRYFKEAVQSNLSSPYSFI